MGAFKVGVGVQGNGAPVILAAAGLDRLDPGPHRGGPTDGKASQSICAPHGRCKRNSSHHNQRSIVRRCQRGVENRLEGGNGSAQGHRRAAELYVIAEGLAVCSRQVAGKDRGPAASAGEASDPDETVASNRGRAGKVQRQVESAPVHALHRKSGRGPGHRRVSQQNDLLLVGLIARGCDHGPLKARDPTGAGRQGCQRGHVSNIPSQCGDPGGAQIQTKSTVDVPAHRKGSTGDQVRIVPQDKIPLDVQAASRGSEGAA